MSEPTIICPNCKTEIEPNESLAAPLIAATRQQYEQKMALKDAEVAKREAAIREQQENVLRVRLIMFSGADLLWRVCARAT